MQSTRVSTKGSTRVIAYEGHVAELLFDVACDLLLGGRRERVASFREDLREVLRQVAAREVQTQDGVRQRVALVDGHLRAEHVAGRSASRNTRAQNKDQTNNTSSYSVRDAVARVEHDASRAAGRVEREHRLNGHVEGGRVERLEDDLRHLLAIGLRVQRRLRHQQRVLLRRHTQLVVERVVPNPAEPTTLVYCTVQCTPSDKTSTSTNVLLHVVPVGDDAVFDGVPELQDAAFALRLVAHPKALLRRAHHYGLRGKRDTEVKLFLIYETDYVYQSQHTSYLLRPTIDGKTARGASSPAKPAFTIPLPLSSTTDVTPSPAMTNTRKTKN